MATELLNKANLDNLPEDKTCSHTIEIRRTNLRRLKAEATVRNITDLMYEALKKRKEKGWSIEIENQDWLSNPENDGGNYNYRIVFIVKCDTPKTKNQSDVEFKAIAKIIDKYVTKIKWEIGLIDGQTPSALEIASIQRNVDYVSINVPEDWNNYFKHIFNRDAQVRIIKRVIEAAIDTNFNDRFHVALIGDPAAGKTEILRSVKRALGEETVLEFDATSTTQAGAIKDLDSRDSLPRIMLVEEIEKADDNSLRWMLGVLDQRAEIRKVTNRMNIQREAKMLTFTTVNDYPLFKKIMSGALQSRFTYHLYCPNLDEKTLRRILEREVMRVGGHKAWINATIEYALKTGCADPRKLIAVCLSGRDDLLKGTFQKDVLDCDSAKFEEILKARKS